MPRNNKEKFIYALMTVLITVPCFVFYCSSYESGGFTIDIIKNNWIFIPIEIVLALTSELLIGGPLSTKMAFKMINPKEEKPYIIEIAIICSTVCIMCPLMSFLATILYNGIIGVLINGAPLNNFLINFIPYWLQKVVLNFPFALLTQLFLIQPMVKRLFKKIYKIS